MSKFKYKPILDLSILVILVTILAITDLSLPKILMKNTCFTLKINYKSWKSALTSDRVLTLQLCKLFLYSLQLSLICVKTFVPYPPTIVHL